MIRRNLVILTGRATSKPELKQVGSNSQVCTIRMVSNKRVKKKDGSVDEKPMYIDAECWGPRAQFASQYIDRGTVVGVTGELELDEWGEGKDKRQKHKIYVSDLQVDNYDKKGDSSGSDSSDDGGQGGDDGGGSDLPF